jgi:DNA-binding transcriptional regulator of glucitol operon
MYALNCLFTTIDQKLMRFNSVMNLIGQLGYVMKWDFKAQIIQFKSK